MGNSGSSKSFWTDPAVNFLTEVTGMKELKWLNPVAAADPMSKKFENWLDSSQISAEKEQARKDELLKKLALGENPYLDSTATTKTKSTLGVSEEEGV